MNILPNITEWFNGIFNLVATKLIVAVIILLIGLIMGKIIERLTLKFLHAVELDRTLQKAGAKIFLEEIASHAVKYIIYAIAILLALETIGLTEITLNIVAIGVMLSLFTGILLSLRDFIPNAVAGLTLMRKGTVKKGMIIEYKDIIGTVVNAGFLEIQIRTNKGDLYVVPNSAFLHEGFSIKKSFDNLKH